MANRPRNVNQGHRGNGARLLDLAIMEIVVLVDKAVVVIVHSIIGIGIHNAVSLRILDDVPFRHFRRSRIDPTGQSSGGNLDGVDGRNGEDRP